MKKHLNLLILRFILVCLMPGYLSAQTQIFTLEDCIDYAWKHNLSIGRANNSIKSATGDLEQAEAAQNPDLVLTGDVNTRWANNYTESDESWERENQAGYSLTLGSTFALYDGGKIDNTITKNRVRLAAAKSDIQAQKELISLNILTAYINVLLSREIVKSSQSQLESAGKQFEYAQVRKSQGLISTQDYLNAKAQYATEKAALVSSKNGLRIMQVSLMQMMNMPVESEFNIKAPDLTALLDVVATPDPSQIYAIALKIRPEVKVAEQELESARIAMKVAETETSPTLSVYGRLGTGYSSTLSGVDLATQTSNQITPMIGMTLSIPLYQRKEASNLMIQATVEMETYRYNLIEVKNNLRKAIEQTSNDLQTAMMTYQASEEQYQAILESYRLTEEMFSQGTINSVDYLTTKSALITAENNLIQSKYTVVLKKKIIDYYLGKPVFF